MASRESKHADEEAEEGKEAETHRGDDSSDDDVSSSGEDENDDSGSEDELSESGGDQKSKAASGAASKAGAAVKTAGSERNLVNQPFDEAVDLSESEGSIVSEDPNSPKKQVGGGRSIKNQPFDEALELSASVQEVASPVKTSAASTIAAEKPPPLSLGGAGRDAKAAAAAAIAVGAEMKNRPFDEEVDLSDSGDSVDTNGQPSPDHKSANLTRLESKDAQLTTPAAAAAAAVRQPPMESKPPNLEPTPASATAKPVVAAPEKRPEPVRKTAQHESSSSSEDSESGDDDDDEEEEDEGEESQSTSQVASATAPRAGGSAVSGVGAGGSGTGGSTSHAAMLANASSYKESDYAHLKVSHEIRELFQYIGRFKAQEIELETRLKCFIPEYIPAVGDMDAFLKVPRPDGEADQLGLKMLDEPSLSQSDATVLDLQLRSTSKKKHGDIVVRSIENAEKAPREIDRWVKSIADLHRTKPPPQVHYTKSMPDIEGLMQVWPEEFEELLAKTTLPGAELDLALEQYVRVICALLDIPVHKNVYESLHVLFTLYLEFRSNQHFMNYDDQLESNVALASQQPLPFTARRADLSTPDDFGSSRNGDAIYDPKIGAASVVEAERNGLATLPNAKSYAAANRLSGSVFCKKSSQILTLFIVAFTPQQLQKTELLAAVGAVELEQFTRICQQRFLNSWLFEARLQQLWS
ncbi:hypothetical protein BBJ28_00005566 [Nothophytophthora sp. Chile5]|nr:hypothetical protein BBJ28_00005566 [Nothophytophthora sp. Chile5]